LCLNCGRSFAYTTGRRKYQYRFEWFKKWIIEGLSVKLLSGLSGYSESTMRRILEYWLIRSPEVTVCNTGSHNLIFDGTYLRKRKGMYAAMDGLTHEIIYGAYGINEGPIDLMHFCRYLKQQGIEPRSITIDGNLHIFKVVKTLWSECIIQRCLVHIQRQGLSWCRRNPKRTDAIKLRQLFLQVCHISSLVQSEEFISEFNKWEKRYGQRIIQNKNRGWVASDLQRARSMLINALPYMFNYLRDNKIPNTTNAIEGYFSRLKQHYRQHKGLSKKHQENYFKWYFYLSPK
jgi:transposase-like protein